MLLSLQDLPGGVGQLMLCWIGAHRLGFIGLEQRVHGLPLVLKRPPMKLSLMSLYVIWSSS